MNANLRKKALFPAVAMVMASVIALSGVSYAWFSMGSKADLQKLDVNVKAASGMQISMDAATWKSTLTTADIIAGTYTGHANQFPTANMMPVSSVGKVNAGKQEMFLGSVTNGLLTATAETDTVGTTGNYIAFDLFFNMTTNKDLYLDLGSAVKFAGAATKGTEYSARVSFLNLGVADKPADARLLQGDALTQANYIWEPNAFAHTQYALDNGFATSLVETSKRDYKGVNAAIGTAIDPSKDDAALSTVATKYIAQDANNVISAQENILSLKKGINKVRIYIWVEGQDIDCNNDVSVDGISTIIKFEQK